MENLNMKAVLRLTGLSADRLRIWERRYGAVRPARAQNGRRVYKESEVQRLKLLAILVDRGHSIGKIARLSDEELLQQVGNSAESRLSPGTELRELIENLAQFDFAKLSAKLGLIRYALSPREFAFEIIPQVMALVGKKVTSGEFSVAQEHVLSEILQGHLKRIYEDLSSLDGLRSSEGAFLFCTREGDTHDFGLLMSAIASRAAGLQTHYVGKNLPASALIDAVRKLKPRAIVIGMAVLPKTEEKVSPQAYLDSFQAHVDERIEIWTGGPASRTLKRKSIKQPLFIFESMNDLEGKLKLLGPLKGVKS